MAEIPKVLGVEIKQFTCNPKAHYETEYWIELMIEGIFIVEESGKPVQKTFVFGKNEQDIYLTGAPTFRNVQELLKDGLEPRVLTVSGDLAAYPNAFQEEVYLLVLASLLKTRKKELEQLRLDCNELVELIRKGED